MRSGTVASRVTRPIQQQRATNNRDHPDKLGHDLRPRNAAFHKASDSEGIGEQKLLYALGKKNPTNQDTD